jgi:hypothetical protein
MNAHSVSSKFVRHNLESKYHHHFINASFYKIFHIYFVGMFVIVFIQNCMLFVPMAC